MPPPSAGRITRRDFVKLSAATAALITGCTPTGEAHRQPAAPWPIPRLDELAADWVPTALLRSQPSVNNFVGGLQAGSDLLSFRALTFPPISQGGSCATLSVNGRAADVSSVADLRTRWYPYQVVRSGRIDGAAITTTTRMAFERAEVLLSVEVEAEAATRLMLGVDLAGYVRRFPGPWQWSVPRPADGAAFRPAVGDPGRVLVVTDSASPAACAFGFDRPADVLSAQAGSPHATWRVDLAPGGRWRLAIVVAVAKSGAEAASSARAARNGFSSLFEGARSGWEDRFARAFTPDNGFFSGHLPTLVTDDAAVRRIYYLSVASMLQTLRTGLPMGRRVYATLGPQDGVTLSYFWDTSLVAGVLALLDPEILRGEVLRWLSVDVHEGYAFDALSGRLVGQWYGANDLALFATTLAYVDFTGDTGFLDRRVRGATVMDHLEATARRWRSLASSTTGLADYGGTTNLLEEVPEYSNQVASLNAGNVWMMRQAARLVAARGRPTAELESLANGLATAVLGLYNPRLGYWSCDHPDGSRSAVPHIYDFDTIGTLLTSNLDPTTRSEMRDFAANNLLTEEWPRAFAVTGVTAASSLRPDHGSNGAYASWPALAVTAFSRLGDPARGVDVLRRCARTTARSSIGQAEQLVATQGVVVADRPALNSSAAISVEAWLNAERWAEMVERGSIVTKDSAALGPAGYALRAGAAGTLSWLVATNGGYVEAVAPGALQTGRWHHVVGVADGRRLTLYADGRSVATATLSEPMFPASGVPLVIGAHPVDPARVFAGAIRGVRIYAHALDPQQVAALWRGGPAPVQVSTVLHVPLDDGAGSTAKDRVSGVGQPILGGRWTHDGHGTALAFDPAAASLQGWAAGIGRQTCDALVAGSFAESVIRGLFDYQPDGIRPRTGSAAGAVPLSGRLDNLGFRGRRFAIAMDAGGRHLET